MNILIIDDHRLDAEQVKQSIQKYNSEITIFHAEDLLTAKGIMNKQRIDSLFCDIEMPNINGIKLIDKLPYKPALIYISRHAGYALDSFVNQPIHYIIKPVKDEEVAIALERVMHLKNKKNERLFKVFKSGYSEYNKIYYDEILYIEAQGDYLKIVCKNQELTSLGRMRKILEELPPYFYRCQRSFIVNINYIKKMESNSIVVVDRMIPISKMYKEELLEGLNNLNC